MAALLKDEFDKKHIKILAANIQKHHARFNQTDFIKAIFNKQWKEKELKQRIRHIS